MVQNGVREFQSLVDAVAVANGTFIGLRRMVAPLGDEVFVGEQFGICLLYTSMPGAGPPPVRIAIASFIVL